MEQVTDPEDNASPLTLQLGHFCPTCTLSKWFVKGFLFEKSIFVGSFLFLMI